MTSSYDEEQQFQHEIKQDQFIRLYDDLVLLIINKLLHLKTLVRFSLVSKRYSSLVSQADTVFVDLDIQQPSSSESQKFSALVTRIRQVKHLHLHLFDNPSSSSSSLHKPFEGDDFFLRSIAAFGSDFEFFDFLTAQSVIQSNNPSNDGGNYGLSNEHLDYLRRMLIRVLKIELKKQKSIGEIISNLKMLETVVYSDDCLGGNLIMGKQQIARLQESNQVLADPGDLSVFATYIPTLNLPVSGYTMNQVIFFSAIPSHQNAENVQRKVADAAKKVMDHVGFIGVSKLKEWEVFNEAVRRIVNERRGSMYVLRVPYSHALH